MTNNEGLRRRNFQIGDLAYHIHQRKKVFEVCIVKIENFLSGSDYLVKIHTSDGKFSVCESELFSAPRAAAKAKEFFKDLKTLD